MPEITVPGWAQQYDKAHSPIQPWGVLLHDTEGGGEQYLDGLFITGKRDDGGGKVTLLSVHFCVYTNGDIHQYAKYLPGECWYCWHAGPSSYPGDTGGTVSDRFIGIEQQHAPGAAYTQAQIDSLIWLLLHIQAAYKGDPHWKNILTEHRIVAPTRKSDPGPTWDAQKGPVYAAWERIKPEDDMPVDNVPEKIYAPELAKLVKAGIIQNPELHAATDAAGVSLLWTVIGRLLDKIETPSPK